LPLNERNKILKNIIYNLNSKVTNVKTKSVMKIFGLDVKGMKLKE